MTFIEEPPCRPALTVTSSPLSILRRWRRRLTDSCYPVGSTLRDAAPRRLGVLSRRQWLSLSMLLYALECLTLSQRAKLRNGL